MFLTVRFCVCVLTVKDLSASMGICGRCGVKDGEVVGSEGGWTWIGVSRDSGGRYRWRWWEVGSEELSDGAEGRVMRWVKRRCD